MQGSSGCAALRFVVGQSICSHVEWKPRWPSLAEGPESHDKTPPNQPALCRTEWPRAQFIIALPYHASRQAFDYTSASRGLHTHHSLPYPSPLLVQNKNSVQHQLIISRSTSNRPAKSPSIAKKKRKSLTLKVKLDIIHRHERGKKTNSIVRHHGLTPSTVSTIFKSADSTKKADETVSSLQAKRTT
ncbi:CENPB DNA-binding domain-containing protein 1 [Portunus trituberculatus]|uniref:CENPB DNA-binding domain-containing protein 1 n=1 Tax=Portunus trituberculatus TaxID=210409 RepID=A0A5B7H3Z2_PORTR|nr:CENPB DNA-binding domain-containing protein 1 [Portunus trituberculatus]